MAKNEVAKSAGKLPAHLSNMESDAKEHRQEFKPDQLIIPRINILQDLSPQVKERNAAYVDGARPGMFFNNVVNKLDRQFLFTPAKFTVAYIAWKPRVDGGGLVDQGLSLDEVKENFQEDGLGRWVGAMSPRQGEAAVNVEIIETPTWVGIATGEAWGPMPVAISFPGTKSKASRKINTTIDMCEEMGANGPFTPPAFYHQFTISSVLETRGDDEWFGFAVTHNGYADERVVEKAKALKVSFDKGDAELAEETHR